jgi:hypothetical protein
MNSDEDKKSNFGSDAVLEEMWRIKAELSAERGHDIHKLFEWMREQEKTSGRNYVHLEPRRIESPTE